MPATKRALSHILHTVPHPNGGTCPVLQIADEKGVYLYHLRRLQTDWGVGFSLTSLDGTKQYEVLVDDAGGLCDCIGHARYGQCKHLIVLAEMVANREI